LWRFRWCFVFLQIVLGGCGYIGEPLPPRLNIPQPIADLAAVERGSKIVIHFTLPRLTTEGVHIKPPLHWELRIGEPGPGEFRVERWAARATSLGEPPEENGRVHCEIPAGPWIARDVVIAARSRGPSGRESDWSKLLVLSVIQPPAAPHDVKAENVREGVRLTWAGAGSRYRVFRRANDERDFALAGTTEKPEYVDRGTEYGKPVRYQVQALTTSGAADVESDLSAEVTFTPQDIVPPAVPTGLTAVATTNTVELTWDRNAEADLAGYRIYRAAPDGQPELLAETKEIPSYTDRKVESGKQYRYAVAAVKKSGMASAQSPAVEATVP
jgi:hypothetical protein